MNKVLNTIGNIFIGFIALLVLGTIVSGILYAGLGNIIGISFLLFVSWMVGGVIRDIYSDYFNEDNS